MGCCGPSTSTGPRESDETVSGRTSDDEKDVALRDLGSLDELLAGRLRVRRGGKRLPLKLELAELSSDQNAHWTRVLNAYHLACGCAQGSLAILLGLAGFALALLTRPGPIHFGGWDALALLVLFLVSGAAGKAVGIQYGRWQLKRAARALRRDLACP